MPQFNSDNTVDDETMDELEAAVEDSNELAVELGLTPPDVTYWLVDYDDINQLAAYQGFQKRYPHWRWGMNYSRRQKKDTYFGGKIFEMVNHDNPPKAFLQKSNRMSDQKSVIAHVEAHADFFKNNNWFPDEPNAAEMLERHANIIESYYDDPNIARDEVEAWIDAVLCIEDTIDQHTDFDAQQTDSSETGELTTRDQIDELDISESVKNQVFEEMLDEASDERVESDHMSDVLSFLLTHGRQYDEESERAIEYEDWQQTILEILGRESHYFAPQKVTKIMNEGWAAYWESIMMGDENLANADEIITYADKQAAVLNSPGLNPYKLGKEMWEYIENRVNRREVLDKLLRVKGITWRNFHNRVDFQTVRDELRANRSDDVPCEKHYSLLRPQNRGFIDGVSRQTLQEEARYMFNDDKYESVPEAIEAVDYRTGWSRLREIRETHNDVTFIDSFLTEEFVQQEEYFAYEFNESEDEYQVSDVSLDAVKRKLLLDITNGGKPKITAADNNYNNAGELLLAHQYNGVELDVSQAENVLERVFQLWGRPVNLKTIVKDDDDEQGMVITYDGDKIVRNETDDVDDIRADEIDYDTKPSDWL